MGNSKLIGRAERAERRIVIGPEEARELVIGDEHTSKYCTCKQGAGQPCHPVLRSSTLRERRSGNGKLARYQQAATHTARLSSLPHDITPKPATPPIDARQPSSHRHQLVPLLTNGIPPRDHRRAVGEPGLVGGMLKLYDEVGLISQKGQNGVSSGGDLSFLRS